MAAARGVVATAVGGMPEVVEDGVNGLLVPPGNPVALAEAVVTLLGDGERRSKMGARARETAVSRYGIENMMGRLAALYEGAL
jgi:starch synthase